MLVYAFQQTLSLYLEDAMTSCGNRTSQGPRHLTFPLSLPAPSPPRLSPFCYRCPSVRVIHVEVRDSLLPIVLSFLPHSCSASCGASCCEAERNRGRERAGKTRNGVRACRKSDLSTVAQKGLSLYGPNSHVVWPVVILCWDRLICSPLQERVCVVDCDVCECGDGLWCYWVFINASALWARIHSILSKPNDLSTFTGRDMLSKTVLINSPWTFKFLLCNMFHYVWVAFQAKHHLKITLSYIVIDQTTQQNWK